MAASCAPFSGVAGAVVAVAPGIVVVATVPDGEPLRVLSMITAITPKTMTVSSVASNAIPCSRSEPCTLRRLRLKASMWANGIGAGSDLKGVTAGHGGPANAGVVTVQVLEIGTSRCARGAAMIQPFRLVASSVSSKSSMRSMDASMSTESITPSINRRVFLRDEVLRRGVMANDRVGRLFGVELEALGDRDANAFALQELGDLGVVGEVGTGGITPRISSATILLAKESGQRRAIFFNVAEFGANTFVPHLRECFGHLDPEAVQHEVVGVVVVREEFLTTLRDARPHRDEHETRVIQVTALDRTKEVGDAEKGRHALAWERESGDLFGASVVTVENEVVAL